MRIIIHNESTAEELDIPALARYLNEKLGEVKVEIRGSPFASLPQEEITGWARRLAAIKVQKVNQRLQPGQELLSGEVRYEEGRILGRTRSIGMIYDGYELSKIFGGVLPRGERNLNFIHIFVTSRLFATWEEGDRRYHLRTSVYGFPSVISTTGLVEAPAKPREYYFLKQQYERMGRDLTELKEGFKGRFIDYGDRNLTEVGRGYFMQAVFFALTGSPFCEDKGCRLYNAHWQEELIFAQLESGSFCTRHTAMLDELRKSLS